MHTAERCGSVGGVVVGGIDGVCVVLEGGTVGGVGGVGVGVGTEVGAGAVGAGGVGAPTGIIGVGVGAGGVVVTGAAVVVGACVDGGGGGGGGGEARLHATSRMLATSASRRDRITIGRGAYRHRTRANKSSAAAQGVRPSAARIRSRASIVSSTQGWSAGRARCRMASARST